MKIENIRMGLATNSSSMHSIIFNLDAPSRDWQNAEFGWDEFCCNCDSAKKMYLAATLYQNMRNIGEDIARAVIESWVKTELVETDEGGFFYGIDHQSLMTLPFNAQTEQPDKRFFQELMAYYMNPELAIVGGNDNIEEDHVFDFQGERHRHLIETDEHSGMQICRKDPNTGHWVLFNRHNGTKIRMHFDKNAPAYTKAFAPELVDVKITDFCPFDCSYCYQDSTKEGVHGDTEYIERLADALKEMGTFEVALGGGEPTMHPDFVKILKQFRKCGIVPNFTTRSGKWLKDETIREAVRNYAGKFAVSINSVHDMERAWHLTDEYGMANGDFDYDKGRHQCRIGFQYVMGSTKLDELSKILRAIPYGCEMTLLGYKDVGRGAYYKPHKYDGWLKVVQDSTKHTCSRIGIDTALANQYKDAVLEAVDERLVTFKEGNFSMYVDAVTRRAAASSYCSEDEFVDASKTYGKAWLELFEKF